MNRQDNWFATRFCLRDVNSNPSALVFMASRSYAPHRDLIFLLIASIAFVSVLAAAVANSNAVQVTLLGPSKVLLLVVLIAGAVGAAFAVWRTSRLARNDMTRLQDENHKLRQGLATAQAVIGAEPKVILYWEVGGVLRVVSNSLDTVAGLPSDNNEVLRFADWLDMRSARILDASTRALFQEGRPFNTIVKTRAGGHLEADGRARSGCAVIRLLDISGYKRQIAHIGDVHERLSRDVAAARALLNALPMPAWLADSSGRLTWVNAAFARAVDAQNVDSVVARQTALLEMRQRQTIAETIGNGDMFHERLPVLIDGEHFPHDVIVVPIRNGSAGAAIDIAEIESAKGEFDRQAEAFDWTLDRVETGVAIFNLERRLVYFNPAFADLWDLDPAWLKTKPMGTDLLDRLRALDRLPAVINYTRWRKSVLRLDDDESKGDDDLWHLPDGRLLHVVSEHKADGNVTFLFTDESAELALKSQFNSLMSVQNETINSLSEGVAVFATDGRLKLHNRAFSAIWKIPPSVLNNEPHIDEIISLAGALYEDRATWSRLKRSITAFSDMRTPIDGQMVRPDNSVIDFATTPLPDGATLLTFVDVTDSKRYERALVERNEALLASDRLKNKFISNVSYELRSPLTNIIGFSELLESQVLGELSEKQREYVHDITFSSKTLLSIIDGILDLATIDAGDLKLVPKELDVRELIDGAIEGVKERAARADLTIDVAIADDTKTFVADAARAKQVFYNLLSNAVGFSRDGGEIQLTCFREGSNTVFQVEDRGIGIGPDEQEKVFGRFVSDSRGSKHRGAGLGLSIIKSLVELHGGHVQLTSKQGAGTTVTVRFPDMEFQIERSDDDGADEISATNPVKGAG